MSTSNNNEKVLLFECKCHKSHIGEVSSQGRPYKSLAPQPQQLAFGVWFSQGLVLVTMVLSLRVGQTERATCGGF